MSIEIQFTTEERFVEDVAAALVRNHMSYCGCDETRPSAHGNRVYNDAEEAYIEARFDEHDPRDGDFDFAFCEELFSGLYRSAEQKADAKWAAAMTLLGVR